MRIIAHHSWSAIIANTIPGEGIKEMEYDFSRHGKPPSPAQADEWLKPPTDLSLGFDYRAAEKEAL